MTDEEKKDYMKTYYQENKERLKKLMKNYQEENKEKLNEYRNNYYKDERKKKKQELIDLKKELELLRKKNQKQNEA
jgi:hypothetical protein